MKWHNPIYFSLSVFLLMTGCSTPTADPFILKKEYVHAYGANLTAQQWHKTGETGKEITHLKDGFTIVKSFSKGLLDGECSQTFANSKLVETREIYKQGKLLSRIKYQTNGLALCEESFVDDKKEKIEWYDTGAPRCYETYQAEVLLQGRYLSPQQETESEVQLKDGIKTERDFYGTLLSKQNIKEGQLAEKILFDAKGCILEKIEYKQGQIHGLRSTFFSSGEPKAVEHWSEGLQDGVTTIYHNGQKSAEISYKQGQKNGIEKHFSDDGILTKEILWRCGRQHGPTSLYFDRQVLIEWYYQDRVVSKRQFDLLTRAY